MNNFFKLLKIFDYIIFIILIFLLNEITLEYLDKTPPLSDRSTFISRILIFLLIISFLIYKFLSSKKFVLFLKNILVFFLLFISLDLLFSIFGFGNLFNNNEHITRRYPSPYDMFSPKPNVRAHNKYGFKGENFQLFNDKKTVTIGFFGGSTGYNGAPPIINRVSELLNKKNIDNFTYNFSSTSSNHTQHKHRLIKFLNFNFDIIIFYGGVNETEGYYLYDPRPGYPFNFYYKELSDTNLFIFNLIRYSSFFGEIEKRSGLVTGLNKIKKEYQENYKAWENSVVNQFKQDIKISKKITERLVKSNFCKKPNFISILQPSNFTDPNQVNLLSLLKKEMENEDFFYDYSDLKDQVTFIAPHYRSHITNDSKQIIAIRITEDILKVLNNCI